MGPVVTCYSAKLGSVCAMHRKAHPLSPVVGKDRAAFLVAPEEGSERLMLRRPGLRLGFRGGTHGALDQLTGSSLVGRW